SSFGLSDQPSIVLVDADDDGLSAAAVMFAGHLPYVWDQKGPTTDKIAGDLREFLIAKGVTPSDTIAPAVYVHAGRDAAERVLVDATMSNGGDVIKAQVALNQLKAIGN